MVFGNKPEEILLKNSHRFDFLFNSCSKSVLFYQRHGENEHRLLAMPCLRNYQVIS